MQLSMKTAASLVARAEQEATARFGRPICVATCDQYGFLLAFARMDGAPVRSIQISQDKAFTAARMGVDTSAFAARLRKDGVPARAFGDDRLTELPGGCVIRHGDQLVGAVGISGLAPSEDQEIAELLAAMAQEAG